METNVEIKIPLKNSKKDIRLSEKDNYLSLRDICGRNGHLYKTLFVQ